MRLIISCLLCLSVTFMMGQDTPVLSVEVGPPDAKPGVCYVKHLTSTNKTDWKAILCEWREFTTLAMLQDDMNPKLSNYDEHYINNRARSLLDRGLSLEIKSYYSSPASNATDMSCKSKSSRYVRISCGTRSTEWSVQNKRTSSKR